MYSMYLSIMKQITIKSVFIYPWLMRASILFTSDNFFTRLRSAGTRQLSSLCLASQCCRISKVQLFPDLFDYKSRQQAHPRDCSSSSRLLHQHWHEAFSSLVLSKRNNSHQRSELLRCHILPVSQEHQPTLVLEPRRKRTPPQDQNLRRRANWKQHQIRASRPHNNNFFALRLGFLPPPQGQRLHHPLQEDEEDSLLCPDNARSTPLSYLQTLQRRCKSRGTTRNAWKIIKRQEPHESNGEPTQFWGRDPAPQFDHGRSQQVHRSPLVSWGNPSKKF